MSGTKDGGRKAKETNLKKHGSDFYKRIGENSLVLSIIFLSHSFICPLP